MKFDRAFDRKFDRKLGRKLSRKLSREFGRKFDRDRLIVEPSFHIYILTRPEYLSRTS